MVGGRKFFSETQGPDNLQNRSQPRQKPSFVIGLIAARLPMSDASKRLAQKAKGRLGVVQAARPATDRGGIGYTIRVFEPRRRLFPGAVLHESPSQCLTARQQAVMRVRERVQREESEGLPTSWAATATDPNPIVMLIVCLLAAASVTDNRIAFTCRATSQDDLVAASSPVSFTLVRQGRKWDKENRSSSGLCRRR
jgi:hypothetical protein